MSLTVASVLLLALTRAEILERMKAPVITQAEGLVQVYASCPEDMRREFQSPVARFAAETVKTLYQGLGERPQRFRKAGIVIYVGDVRTNLTEVVTTVATNDAHVVSRIRLRAPGYADLDRLRLEIVKGFYRSVKRLELSDEEATAAYRRADPRQRVADERKRLEDWLAGNGTRDDEEGLRLMRRVFDPGRASTRDVLIFASRLYLYPPQQDVRFLEKYDCLSFREAVKLARTDLLVRAVALRKSYDLVVLAGGKGPDLGHAADVYRLFLLELARGEKDEGELMDLLNEADEKLNIAFEKADKP